MQLTEVAELGWTSRTEIDKWTTPEPTQFRVMKSTGGLSHATKETGQRPKRNRTQEKLFKKWLREFERDVVVFQDKGGGVEEIELQCYQCGLALDPPQIVHILENGDTKFENASLASIDPRHTNPQIDDESPVPRICVGNSSRSTHIKCIPKKFLREVIGALHGRRSIDNKSLIKAMLALGIRIDPGYDQTSKVFSVPVDIRSLRNLPTIQNEELLYAALAKWLNPSAIEDPSSPP